MPAQTDKHVAEAVRRLTASRDIARGIGEQLRAEDAQRAAQAAETEAPK